jgi:ring-1,2-phenylacetyl-CoA epoxidase subunit PaaE
MAVHFHPLKVKEIRKETADCVTVTFDVPENLESEFLFKEGQNITIRASIGGEEVRRSYSICTAPHEKSVKVAIKKVDGGLFSKFANETLSVGDELEILPPVGKFNAKPVTGKPGNYLAIAAGSGITPVISIIKHTLKSEPGSNFTLLYGNRSRSSIIFFEELEALKNRYIERFNFINILSREKTDSEINYGRIDGGKLKALQSLLSFPAYDSIYICGPEKMIFDARDFLAENGVDASRVHFELFTTPGQSQEKKQAVINPVETDLGPKSNVTVKLDGRSFEFTLGRQGEAILDAALRQGADLPYACKGGVCCTCRAKLVEGEVSMDVNYALEPEEVAQGFILTCQSHPISENIVVDFDVK